MHVSISMAVHVINHDHWFWWWWWCAYWNSSLTDLETIKNYYYFIYSYMADAVSDINFSGVSSSREPYFTQSYHHRVSHRQAPQAPLRRAGLIRHSNFRHELRLAKLPLFRLRHRALLAPSPFLLPLTAPLPSLHHRALLCLRHAVKPKICMTGRPCRPSISFLNFDKKI